MFNDGFKTKRLNVCAVTVFLFIYPFNFCVNLCFIAKTFKTYENLVPQNASIHVVIVKPVKQKYEERTMIFTHRIYVLNTLKSISNTVDYLDNIKH